MKFLGHPLLGYIAVCGLLGLFASRYYHSQVQTVKRSQVLSGEVIRLHNSLPNRAGFDWHLIYQNRKYLARVSPELGQAYLPGRVLLIKGILEPLPSHRQQEEFNYAQYLRHQGFSGMLDIREVFPLEDEPRLFDYARRTRLSLSAKLDTWPLNKENRGLIKALFLGLKGEIDRETKANYGAAGLMHLLAVSGLHLGIIYLVLNGILSRLVRGKHQTHISSILMLAGIWSFCLLSGAGPSIIRAATMFSLFSIAKLFRRKVDAIRMVIFSAFLLLYLHPLFIHQIGFLLSYLAVIGILFLLPKLQSLYRPQNKVLGYIIDLGYVSISAQLFTSPLSLFSFGGFPTYFLVSNLLSLPLTSIIMYWGLLEFGCEAIGLGPFLLEYYEILLQTSRSVSAEIASWPGALISISLSAQIALGIVSVLLLWVFTDSWSSKKRSFAALIIWLLISGYSIGGKARASVKIHLHSGPEPSLKLVLGKRSRKLNLLELTGNEQHAYHDEYFIVKPLSSGAYLIQAPWFTADLYLVNHFQALEVEAPALIAYYGSSFKNEKSWLQWSQDCKLKFTSSRLSYQTILSSETRY